MGHLKGSKRVSESHLEVPEGALEDLRGYLVVSGVTRGLGEFQEISELQGHFRGFSKAWTQGRFGGFQGFRKVSGVL